MAVGGMVLMTIGIYLFSRLSAGTGKGELIIFMVVIVFKPQGLLGRKEERKV